MIPAIEFEEANFTFGKPVNMTDEQCSSLNVFKGKDTEGNPIIISKWQLSKEDLEFVNRTGTMYIQISGHGMPPIAPLAEHPFVKS